MSIPFTLSPIATVIAVMYGIAKDIDTGIDRTINDMKQSGNTTVSRTGRVLEKAKIGFGIGYITPVVVIAVGQILLGHPLIAIGKAAAMVFNPIAMTCAAVGAIIYGWSALSSQEREEILEKLSKGLEVGIELIKSVIHFIIEKTKEILSSENIEELKQYIATVASAFGKSLSEVTHKFIDILSDGYDALKEKAEKAYDKTAEAATEVYKTSTEKAGKVTDKVFENAENAAEKIRGKISKSKTKLPAKTDKKKST